MKLPAALAVTADRPLTWQRIASALLAIVALESACGAMYRYLSAVWLRVFVPYAIQWLEPLFLHSALRAWHHQPLYGPPTVDFIGGMYTPGYDFASALLFDLFGVGFAPMRLLSFGAFVAVLVIVGIWVFAATRCTLWAIVAPCLVVPLCEQPILWCSTANVDSVYLAMVLAACALAYWKSDETWAIIAAALLSAFAFLVKQQAFLLAGALTIYCLSLDRRKGFLFAAVCAGTAGLASLVLLISSSGWFWTTAVTMPGSMPWNEQASFFQASFQLAPVATLLFFAGPVLLCTLPAPRGIRGHRVFWLSTWVAIFVTSYAGLLKEGGNFNSVIPLYTYGVLMVATAPGALQPTAAANEMRDAALTIGFLTVTLAMHMGVSRADSLYLIAKQSTSWEEARERAYQPVYAFEKNLREVISHYEGRVFVGARALQPFQLGQPGNFHQTVLYNGTVRTDTYDMAEVLEDALRLHEFDAMILWKYWQPTLQEFVSKYYRKVGSLGYDPLERSLQVEIWVPRT